VTHVLDAFLLLLVLTVVAGLWRVVRGPTDADRLLAPQLFGTTGVAALLVAAVRLEAPALRDVALLLALLAVVTSAAFAVRLWGRTTGEEERR
jgi:multicomponent Na+:H+ antiporter subunit F